MPNDLVTVDQTVVPKDTFGGNDRVVLEKYEAPSDFEGNPAPDPFREQDRALAKTMMAWLEKHYPGHLWTCVADLKQGVVCFNIPILMGTNEYWVVNLSTTDIVEGMRRARGKSASATASPAGASTSPNSSTRARSIRN